MSTTKRRPRNMSDARRVAYWKDVAAKRIRLCWATGILGGIAGFAVHALFSMPPLWM